MSFKSNCSDLVSVPLLLLILSLLTLWKKNKLFAFLKPKKVFPNFLSLFLHISLKNHDLPFGNAGWLMTKIILRKKMSKYNFSDNVFIKRSSKITTSIIKWKTRMVYDVLHWLGWVKLPNVLLFFHVLLSSHHHPWGP